LEIQGINKINEDGRCFSVKNEDVRVLKTKEALMEALVELLKIKSLNSISVRDLTKKARVSRSTFYRNYIDKYDFLERTMNVLLDGIAEESSNYIDEKKVFDQFYNKFFAYVYKNAVFFRAFINNDDWPQFKRRLIEGGIIIYKKILSGYEKQIKNDISIDFIVNYIVSAHVGIVSYWLATGEEYSPQYMAKQLSLLTNEGILKSVGLDNILKLPQ